MVQLTKFHIAVVVKEQVAVLRQRMVRRSERVRIDPQKQITPIANANMPLLLGRPCPGVENLNDLPAVQHHLKHGEPCRLRKVGCFLVPLRVILV